MRLLLDEHLDPDIARGLRRRGHDVIAVAEREELRGSIDEALLEWAAAHRRVVVTYDVRDFSRLLDQRAATNTENAGVIFVSTRSHPLGDKDHGPLLRDLAAVLDAHRSRDTLMGRAIWLAGTG